MYNYTDVSILSINFVILPYYIDLRLLLRFFYFYACNSSSVQGMLVA